MVEKLFLIIFTLLIGSVLDKTDADDSSVKDFDQSCREFKELMVNGNKLMFLRTNIATREPSWKALICLGCNSSRESRLLKVTSLKDKSIDWHYKEKDFLAINEILIEEDNVSTKKLGMQSILASVRTKCRSQLEPVNEGSHLELHGRERCVRHEYLRQYLKRKFDLNETDYAEMESKKDLAEEDFVHSCHQMLQRSADKNIISDTIVSIYLKVRNIFGKGLGEYDPIVARDAKSFQRQIATEKKSK